MNINLYRLPGLSEIEEDPRLQRLYWILLIGFFISFMAWIQVDFVNASAARAGKASCLPYFQNCAFLYFLEGNPLGYSLEIFYAGLTGTLLLSIYFVSKKNWNLGLWLLLPSLIWKVLMSSVLSFKVAVDHEYFHIPFVILFIFAQKKIYFMQRALVFIYLLAALVKQTESWVVGSYFSSLNLGLPLVPNFLIPFVTNAVGVWEIFGSWLLLSENRRWQRTALFVWVIFHLYSIILVNFPYPGYCIPILLGLFWPEIKSQPLSFQRSDGVGWGVMGWLALVSIIPYFVGGNQLYSLQSMKFGVGMIDANHQCVSQEIDHLTDGSVKNNTKISQAAMSRCAPYFSWHEIDQRCRNSPDLKSVEWSFISSINGGPFYELVKVPNACVLKYKPFAKNEWIQFPESGAPIAGYPRKNFTKGPNDRNQLVYSTPVEMIYPSQKFFARHLHSLIFILRTLWWLTLGFYTWRALMHYRMLHG